MQTAAEHLDAINAVGFPKVCGHAPRRGRPHFPSGFPTHSQSPGYNLSLVRDAIANDLATTRLGTYRNVYLNGIQWAIVHGSRSDEANIEALYDAMNVYRHGGTAALIAKYPISTDVISLDPTEGAH